MVRRVLAWLLCGICAASLSISFAPSPSEPEALAQDGQKSSLTLQARTDFKRDILPILASKCFACHGPDSSTRKAGLRLDQRDAAMKKSRTGATPIVPGDAVHSELMRRVVTEDLDARMPPMKTGKALTAAEKDLLKRWIDAGAEYQLHWAFVKPERPAIPEVKSKAWVKNEIDAFILARLEGAGLAPSPSADAVTLIRRLSLDLRGLPPTLAEVDEFVNAWDTAGAIRGAVWERWVDRMLASPHYGEKMAIAWLDLARYGDTSGYHMDSTRQMWLWRDWVIDAFNNNMPFDQFTIEQLAGDLLPSSDVKAESSRKIASGFNRNTRYNEEGGVDPEEYVVRYNIDRTNTLGQIWLGLTLGCAECHSHKYDPISHQEYYQLFAYFTGITEPMLEGHNVHGKPLAPLLKMPTPEQVKSLDQHNKMLGMIEEVLTKELARFKYLDPLDGQALPEMITDQIAAKSFVAWQTRAKNDEKLPLEIRVVLKLDPVKQTPAQKKELKEYYLRKVHADASDVIGPIDRDYEEHRKKIRDIEDAIPHTLITEEMAKPRPAHVLIRGDFLQKGERVERGVPAVLTPLPRNAPANRLGLARWLVSREHPLTARVTVNRLWAQMFGQGIVRTPGDFGTQGDYPSHPELLDWLAVEFSGQDKETRRQGDKETRRQGDKETRRQGDKEQGWNVKHVLRTIVLSSTYQQSSVYRKDVVKIDPNNRLLAFMPRYRLGAEELRDNALAISGLMNAKIGGSSFMPYQPADYYKFKNEDWPWTPSTGDEQYRRGLYAFWRRTALHPMFVVFDSPTREECVVSRPRTNSPLQALVTLNDPTFVEAARVFAQKLLTDGPKRTDARLAFIFRKATCRTPSDAEMKVLLHRYEQQRARFAGDRDAASRFSNAGQYSLDPRLDVQELAAWMAVCNMVLNLDEVLTRE